MTGICCCQLDIVTEEPPVPVKKTTVPKQKAKKGAKGAEKSKKRKKAKESSEEEEEEGEESDESEEQENGAVKDKRQRGKHRGGKANAKAKGSSVKTGKRGRPRKS